MLVLNMLKREDLQSKNLKQVEGLNLNVRRLNLKRKEVVLHYHLKKHKRKHIKNVRQERQVLKLNQQMSY